ncbi:MAG: hypothetical protein F6K20_13200 [Moorea sp. SIO2C4]|nr:hypothetical protein [Moorena sp. SIO2C4]
MGTDKQSQKCWFVSTTVLKKRPRKQSGSDAEVRPLANLIRLGQGHLSGLGEPVRSWGFPP